MSALTPTIADLVAARERLRGRVWHAPLLPSTWLSDLTGARVWLKLESVQPTGSFKIRGAFNALLRLRESQPDVRTVTTASAGNHGAAMAAAAAALGLTVRVHLPATAPAVKKDALRRLGAVVIEAPTYDDAEIRTREEVAAGGVKFVSAYSDSDVIAGAGTVGLEMFEDEPSMDTVLVPLGGGGLLSGVAIAARSRRPDALVVGCEADASPVFTAALEAGRPVTVPVHDTIADGLAGNMEPDSQTFAIVRDLVDRVVRVREPAIVRAMHQLVAHERLIAEGAGATGVGALLDGRLDLAGRHVGVVVTGRNGEMKPGVFSGETKPGVFF